MQNALDLLAEIGHTGFSYFWLPVITWTMLALLVRGGLERWTGGHPLVKYRLYQALLLSLPLGVLLNAVTDFSFLYFDTPSPGEISVGPLSAWAVGAESGESGMGIGLLIGVAVGLLSVAALLVAIARGIRLVGQASSLAEFRRQIEPQSAWEILDAEAARLIRRAAPLRDIRIAVVQEPVVPMTFGVLKPVMVLPDSLLANPASLRMAVAHELVHIRRYDALLHWIEEAIEVPFAAWPAVRSVRRHIRTYREISCDLETLSEPSFSRKAYAQLIGSFSFAGTPGVGTSLGMAATPNELKRRISAMKNDTFRTIPSSKLLRASYAGAAVMLFTVLFVIACTDLVRSEDETERAQVNASTPSPVADEGVSVEGEPPQFPGGEEALVKFLQTEVKYPEIARKAGIEGKVFVQFMVGKDGKVRDVKVARGIGSGLDEEAVRVVQAMPDWTPAKQGGQTVPFTVWIPITFKLGA